MLKRFDKRRGLSKKVVQQLRTSFGDHILKIVIPRSIRMAEAPSKGIPGIIYSPRNAASEEYRRLTKELLEGSLADTVLTKLGSTADLFRLSGVKGRRKAAKKDVQAVFTPG